MEQQELESAARFYGLDLKVFTAGADHNDDLALSKLVERNETLAVAIAANALASVDEKVLLQALSRQAGGNVPLLILGVTQGTDPTLLKAWSGGAIVGVKPLVISAAPRAYVWGRVEGFTRQLTDVEMPFLSEGAFSFVLDEARNAEQIAVVKDGTQCLPVFIRANVHPGNVFLACEVLRPSPIASPHWEPREIAINFPAIAPALMIVRFCAGERAWHATFHYANLTIDDAWLREPYGCLNYRGLLAEMDKHNFHTTIAFIPWNYKRSEPEVVSLIRNHPDRFSICVHGDNHDHKEFTDYQSKSLAIQVGAIKQSLSRMESFQMLTGIPYDKVMVFPHSIAPENTLEALKAYHYLATINAWNVPMDRPKPSNLSFVLRPVTLMYGNFPSITRYSAEVPIPNGFIAMNEFLGNPLLFYCHHEFFGSGMGAFDGVADQVNKLEPDTRWSGLSDIVRHLYLVRLRDDSNYDVLAFSDSISLDNVSGRDSVFYVRKPETDRPAITSVNVDGQSCPYQLHDGYLEFSLAVPGGKSRNISIGYGNDPTLPSIDLPNNSLLVYVLRTVSDFRDLELERLVVGRAFFRLYYKIHAKNPALGDGFALVSIASCICGAWLLLWIIIRIANRRRMSHGRTA